MQVNRKQMNYAFVRFGIVTLTLNRPVSVYRYVDCIEVLDGSL